MTPPLPHELPDRVAGVDVSQAQPTLDWGAIARSGARFAWVKASEGAGYIDPAFGAHALDAQRAGLDVGAYHFFRSRQDGRVQADRFVRTTELALMLTLPPCIDWEDQADAAKDPGLAAGRALAFVERVEELLGRPAIVYTGPSFVALMRAKGGEALAELARRDLWIAHYRFGPADGRDYRLVAPTIPPPWTLARCWQWCGNRGPRIEGVPVDLDRNVFLGGVNAYEAWLGRGPARTVDAGEALVPGGTGAANPLGWTDRSEQAEEEKAT